MDLKIVGHLANRALRGIAQTARDSADIDRLLQLTMESVIEGARERHRLDPSPNWRVGEPLKMLLAGYSGTRNTGSDVRVEEMILQFRHLFGDENLDLSITTIDPSKTRGYFKTVKQLHIPKTSFPTFLDSAIRGQHAVVTCEGSMFKSKFANALSTMFVGALGLAAAQDKLSIGYGGEAGAMDAGLEALIRKVLGDETFVLTRNEESSVILDRLGVPNWAGTDTAWSFDRAPRELADKLLRRAGWDETTPIVAICPVHPFCWPVKPRPVHAAIHALTGAFDRDFFDAVYFYQGGSENEERLHRYIDQLAGAVDDFRRNHEIFPIVVGMEALDRRASELLVAKLNHRHGAIPTPLFVADEHDIFATVALLRRASMIVSSRYHALVCSMPAGVPSIGVTIDERIRNLMRDRGHPELSIEADAESLDDVLLDRMESVWSNPDGYRDAIERCVVRNLVRMGEMGLRLVEHVRAKHPRFPFRAPIGSGGAPFDHLPPLGATQRALCAKHAPELGSASTWRNGPLNPP